MTRIVLLAALLLPGLAAAEVRTLAPRDDLAAAVAMAAPGDEIRLSAGIYAGRVTLDRALTLRGEPVPLSPIEYDLLRVLLRSAGKVLTHAQLLRAVWGDGYSGERHLLQVTMSNLRRKVEPDPSKPRLIRTEPGVGYRITAEPQTDESLETK